MEKVYYVVSEGLSWCGVKEAEEIDSVTIK